MIPTISQNSNVSEPTWDFSNSKYLGQEKEVFFVGNDSNRIKMIDKDAILDFSQDKDRLLLKRLQTPLLNIDFGNSFEYLKFPFPLNDSLTCQIEGKGTYCSKNKLVLSGTCCTKTMAKGKYQFEGGYCSFDNNLNPTYHYYEKDHLGSICMVVNENGTIEQVNHYYPFGGVYGDLAYNSELQKNKYIGKEFDHTSGLDWYDHGARMYDAAKGSWDRMDKLAEKYKATTPYAYSINNPSKFADIDGLDIVYMLQGGIEQKRIISKQNITYVQNLANQGKEWIKAEMPKILEGFSNAIYQKYDYLIAAETSYFNQNKNLGKTYRHTNGEFVNSVKNIPDLDPTLVKSIIMEETRMGTIAGHGLNDATKDIMQANVWYSKNSNDWNQSKEQFGLKMRQGATPYLSVHAGIGILYQKGLKSSVINNKKTTIFKGWRIAVKKYNGGGNRNYYKEVMNFYNNAK